MAGALPTWSAAWRCMSSAGNEPRDFWPRRACCLRLSKWPSKHGAGDDRAHMTALQVRTPSGSHLDAASFAERVGDHNPHSYNRRMSEQPLVGVVMGSKSDYEVLSAAVEILRELKIPHEARIVSAHRTPDRLFEYAATARRRGLQVIIA